MVGSTHWLRGDIAQAIDAFEVGSTYGELSGFNIGSVTGKADLSFLYATLGAWEDSQRYVDLVVDLIETVPPSFQAWPLIQLGRGAIYKGDLGRAADWLAQGAAKFDREKSFAYGALALLVLGEIELALAHEAYDKAQEVIDAALPRLLSSGFRSYVPHVVYLQARVYVAVGQIDAGQRALQDARAQAEALGALFYIDLVDTMLSEIDSIV